VKAYEMAFIEYLRKLMGWCPMKDSIRKGRQEDSYSGFKSENGSFQLMPFPSGLQESKVIKAQAMYKGLGIAKILFLMLVALLPPIVIPLLGFGFSPSPTGPDHIVIFDPGLSLILDIYLTLILYLGLLAIILYNRTTVMLTHEKIIIRRHLFKSLVLQKEDVAQISVSKKKGYSYRWLLRLFFLAVLIFTLSQTIENITKDLSMETTPLSYKLIGVLVSFWIVAFYLVLYYIFELAAAYRQVLKITTRSNLNMEFYTDEPEEIMSILKKENE
jgi:hypothetical protein